MRENNCQVGAEGRGRMDVQGQVLPLEVTEVLSNLLTPGLSARLNPDNNWSQSLVAGSCNLEVV